MRFFYQYIRSQKIYKEKFAVFNIGIAVYNVGTAVFNVGMSALNIDCYNESRNLQFINIFKGCLQYKMSVFLANG